MTKVITMYLPQFHETEENNQWWGKGFTDWVSVKSSTPLYENHRQPRRPLNNNYYDLSDIKNIEWQVKLAKKYGVYGFCIYHYWFSTQQTLLTKPAELLLENKEINMPFFLAWDNNSWVRTWSKYKHNTNAWSPKADADLEGERERDGVLAKLDYGTEKDWKNHFEYLNKFFMDERYIKIDNKPLFIIWNYTNKDILKKMCDYWRLITKDYGYDGIYLMNRFNTYDFLDGFDSLFTYEPMFSAWQNKNLIIRVFNKIKDQFGLDKGLTVYDYDKVWKSIIKRAKKCNRENVMYGGFVSYDDTPRRGIKGKVVRGETPEKFEKYLKELLLISNRQNKKYVFLTAWNEWGEGAYLEPDCDNKFAFLEALLRAITQGGEKNAY